MKDLTKKLAAVGLTIGGLEYAKYRFKGGKPLLEVGRNYILRLKAAVDTLKGAEPVTLRANDYKIV